MSSDPIPPPINLINNLYRLIDQNIDFIQDLKQHNNQSNVSLDSIDEYKEKQQCANTYYTFIKNFLSNITYVSCDKFISIIDKNINELIELIDKPNVIPILVVTNSTMGKSNFFYNLYFLNEMRKKNKKLEYAYGNILEIMNDDYSGIKNNLGIDIEKNIILIYCDDISYSGSQLSFQISAEESGIFYMTRTDAGKGKMPLNPKIKFFINLVGILPDALSKIENEFANKDNLIIPNSTIRFKNDKVENILKKLGNYRTNDCIILRKNDNEDEIELSSMMDEYFVNNNKTTKDIKSVMALSLVYPFHKYPDAQSTFGNLCRIKGIKKDEKIINIDKFIEKFCDNDKKLIENIKFGELPKKLSELFDKVKHDKSKYLEIMTKILANWDIPAKFKTEKDLDWICISQDVTGTKNLLKNSITGEDYIKIINSETVTGEDGKKFECRTHAITSFYKRGYNFNKYKYSSDDGKKCQVNLPIDFFNEYPSNTGGYKQYIKYKINKYKTKYNALKN